MAILAPGISSLELADNVHQRRATGLQHEGGGAERQAGEESLRLPRTDHLDRHQLHRFDPKVAIADSVGAKARVSVEMRATCYWLG